MTQTKPTPKRDATVLGALARALVLDRFSGNRTNMIAATIGLYAIGMLVQQWFGIDLGLATGGTYANPGGADPVALLLGAGGMSAMRAGVRKAEDAARDPIGSTIHGGKRQA